MNKRIIIVAVLVTLLVSSCTIGSRRVVTDTRKVANFDQVVFEGVGELAITQGARESLTIEAESNIMRRIETVVQGGTLYIGMRPGIFGVGIVPTKSIKFDLEMKDVRAVELSGAGIIHASGITVDDLNIDTSGAGKIIIRALDADTLEIQHSGIGSCEVSGRVTRQSARLSGAGEYDAQDLESEEAEVEVNGVGTATVWATERLDVEISGAGSVRYYGDPVVSQDVSGLGRVRKLGDR